MIRVTYADNSIEIDYKNKKPIINFTSERKIVKIEKQVKDLTLDEVRKLGFERTFEYEWGFGLDTDDVSDDFHNDDYIDITKLVKGER